MASKHAEITLNAGDLLTADVVTAESELVRASADENSDLFWGLRGGGGNFGIVTEYEFRLHPVGPIVLAGPIFWPMEDSPEVLRFYRDWIADAPDELMTIVIHRKAPAVPFVPTELHGQLIVGVACCYAGPVADGRRSSVRSRSSARRCSTSACRSRTSSTRRCSMWRFRTAGGTTSGPATSRSSRTR
jgi:FAD/FMN-containing dehydrogenase